MRLAGRPAAAAPDGSEQEGRPMDLRAKARLSLSVAGDALDRMLYPRLYGTPREHVDRIGELLGRRPRGEEPTMGEMDAAARAAGYKVEARCSIGHGTDALLELDGEEQPVRWPLAEVAEGLGVAPRDVPGMRMLVTVRESPETGRTLSGFRRVDS